MKSYTTKKGLTLRNWKKTLTDAAAGNPASQEVLTIYADSLTVGLSGSLDSRLNRSADGELASEPLRFALEQILETVYLGYYVDALNLYNDMLEFSAIVLELEDEDRETLRSEIYERSQARVKAVRQAQSWS